MLLKEVHIKLIKIHMWFIKECDYEGYLFNILLFLNNYVVFLKII